MIDISAELQPAAEADVIGLAFIGEDRVIQRKIGHLVDWLPPIGVDCCSCVLLTGMESELAALATGKREVIALSGVRGASPELNEPVTTVISWDATRTHFMVIAIQDFAARQLEILIGSERRARRLMEEQLEAANSEARFASLARTRLRLARDLHDTLVHSIIALLTQIRLIRHFLATDLTRVSEGLATAEEAAISGLARARDAIARLRMPGDLELAPDLEEMLRDFMARTGIEVAVEIDDGARDSLHRYRETVQRILSEALRNIERHAEARRAWFRAAENSTTHDRQLMIEIGDDGRGFDLTVSRPGHFGLMGMSEFAELAGGKCLIESSLGEGTLVRVTLPAIAPQTARPSDALADAEYGVAEQSQE